MKTRLVWGDDDDRGQDASGRDRAPHLRGRWVSAEELEEIRRANTRHLGPHDANLPIEAELHDVPELRELIRRLQREDAAEKAEELRVAQLRDVLANSLLLPRDIPPGVSRLSRAIYQNILPPRRAASPSEDASSDGETEKDTADVAPVPTLQSFRSFHRSVIAQRQAAPPTTGGDPSDDVTRQNAATPGDGIDAAPPPMSQAPQQPTVARSSGSGVGNLGLLTGADDLPRPNSTSMRGLVQYASNNSIQSDAVSTGGQPTPAHLRQGATPASQLTVFPQGHVIAGQKQQKKAAVKQEVLDSTDNEYNLHLAA